MPPEPDRQQTIPTSLAPSLRRFGGEVEAMLGYRLVDLIHRLFP